MSKTTLFSEKLKEREMYLTRRISVTKVILASKTMNVKELLRDPNSEMAKATAKGRKFHKALETGVIEDAYTQKVVEVFRKDILAD